MLFALAKSRHPASTERTGSTVTEQAIILLRFGRYGTALQGVRWRTRKFQASESMRGCMRRQIHRLRSDD